MQYLCLFILFPTKHCLLVCVYTHAIIASLEPNAKLKNRKLAGSSKHHTQYNASIYTRTQLNSIDTIQPCFKRQEFAQLL